MLGAGCVGGSGGTHAQWLLTVQVCARFVPDHVVQCRAGVHEMSDYDGSPIAPDNLDYVFVGHDFQRDSKRIRWGSTVWNKTRRLRTRMHPLSQTSLQGAEHAF